MRIRFPLLSRAAVGMPGGAAAAIQPPATAPPAAGEADTASRWSTPSSYLSQWDERARFVAKTLIPPGSAVLDLGCGRMALEQFLPPGCTYVPADLAPWAPHVLPVNLDADEYPAGSYDITVMLGVLSYLRNPRQVLMRARHHSKTLILSFAHPRSIVPSRSDRKAGKVNHFRPRKLVRILGATGWCLDKTIRYRRSREHNELIYLMHR